MKTLMRLYERIERIDETVDDLRWIFLGLPPFSSQQLMEHSAAQPEVHFSRARTPGSVDGDHGDLCGNVWNEVLDADF